MGRGGKRPGAGRPPGTGKYGEPTKAVRLPISVADRVVAWLDKQPKGRIRPPSHSEIEAMYKPNRQSSPTVPLFLEAVAAGFPSPATDYVDEELDLNQYLIEHPDDTLFLRASGESMIGAGIYPGDLLIVDRAIAPRNNSVVVALVDGEFTVKRMQRQNDRVVLVPENPDYEPLEITEAMDFQVWGVVTNTIHPL